MKLTAGLFPGAVRAAITINLKSISSKLFNERSVDRVRQDVQRWCAGLESLYQTRRVIAFFVKIEFAAMSGMKVNAHVHADLVACSRKEIDVALTKLACRKVLASLDVEVNDSPDEHWFDYLAKPFLAFRDPGYTSRRIKAVLATIRITAAPKGALYWVGGLYDGRRGRHAMRAISTLASSHVRWKARLLHASRLARASTQRYRWLLPFYSVAPQY
jgi:hypothetical protein